MLVAGLYDGNVAVYNLQSSLIRPLNIAPMYESDAGGGKHMETCWQVRWIDDDLDNYLNFFSGENIRLLCSNPNGIDISVSNCPISLVSEDSRVTHWTLVKTSLTCCDKMVLDFGKQLQNIDMEMLKGTKFGSGARALAVKPDDDTVYLVGTEEGLIHLCTTEYASKYIATFQAHNTPVRTIEETFSNIAAAKVAASQLFESKQAVEAQTPAEDGEGEDGGDSGDRRCGNGGSGSGNGGCGVSSRSTGIVDPGGFFQPFWRVNRGPVEKGR